MARLIFLTATPPSVAAGSGTWVGISVLRKALVALGHEVTLIAPAPGSRNTLLARVGFNIRARARLRSMNADALIAFDMDGVFVRNRDLLHVAAIKGVLADEATFERGWTRASMSVLARLEAKHVRGADRVITTSRYSAERIARSYGIAAGKVFVIPEPIDIAAWDGALRAAPREEGPMRVLCVAHLYPRKCVDTLLRAFARLNAPALLRVVGVGPEKARLEALARELAIADRVDFLGHLPFDALAAEYRNAAVFALPTAQEGFGIVFLEAMAASLPIVAARAGAAPELVKDGLTGLLIDPGDHEALAAALGELLQEPAMRLSMGAAGNANVRQYDAAGVAERFLEVLRSGRPDSLTVGRKNDLVGLPRTW